MAWQDKTLEARYTSPSGKQFPFHYEKVSRETNLKTGIFEFPDRDGAHVQHQGAGAKSFPLVCIFTGPDCMDQADAFEESLYERDVAELRHPVYGTVRVIPTGYIKREDDLVNALNESRVTVTFTETMPEESTPMDAVSADEIEATYNDLLESFALDFAENISIDTVAEELVLQSMLVTQAQIIEDNMIPIIETDTFALAEYRAIVGELRNETRELRSIISNIQNAVKKTENFVVRGLNVARLTLNLMRLPSRILVGIMEKVKGYSMLATNIVNQFRNDPFGTRNIANSFHSTGLVLSGCVASIASGAALSIAQTATSVNNTEINRTPVLSPASPLDSPSISTDSEIEIITREETIQIAYNILALLEATKTFQDSRIENNVVVDANSNSYISLYKLVYSCVQLITNISLSLPMRRTITLDQDRQIIELTCELYGSVDFIDKFISDNDLSADELEVIPMGREVTYHVHTA